ncbi:MAG TPA: dihydrolipoamide acetyltransferase family protein [Acidimicrobiales bacterium]|nr:dihydrolipoamide acetyltransferase family protein [Acidimicrobiales bacterium]
MADVTLPSLGESVTEGIITQWFKKVGDTVARDEPLFEVSTDKVDSEMPSPAAGVLTQILAEEGDTVETGSRVAVIDESASTTPSAPSAPSTPSAPIVDEPQKESAVAPVSPKPVVEKSDDVVNGVVVSPVVRRILSDGGVEPSTIQGSGPGGSITRRDAERAVLDGPTEEVVVALSNGRRRMGEHMAVSAQVTPHGFVAIEADGAVFAKLDALGRTTRDGVAVTDELLVSLAAVRALAEFEFLNATFTGEELVVHRTVNLGLVRSVADDGMLVPVVHAAAGLTLRALARRVRELDERVLSRHLTTDDLMGGTFTVLGAPSVNTLWTEPIIIQPQVAVLSVGAVRQVPVILNENQGATVGIGRHLVLGLSFDHRVCEPVAAVSYLERVSQLLAGLDVEGER